jgi:hypothetical protein
MAALRGPDLLMQWNLQAAPRGEKKKAGDPAGAGGRLGAAAVRPSRQAVGNARKPEPQASESALCHKVHNAKERGGSLRPRLEPIKNDFAARSERPPKLDLKLLPIGVAAIADLDHFEPHRHPVPRGERREPVAFFGCCPQSRADPPRLLVHHSPPLSAPKAP